MGCTSEVSLVALLVESRLLKTERVDNVVDSLGTILGTVVVAALSGGVGTNICKNVSNKLHSPERNGSRGAPCAE